ncbi:DUF4649 family protein [Lactococcus lactis]|jgi:hypothetical protein|nr:DUF4649 family protein [Lactococcus lactis]ARE19955.1 DUF4649 family protein [Lactococcus lactis subsp. lactis]MDN6010202.1 DUF4649 family protein [Lactococcus lactis]MDN6063737.1 DUF4649 family protein [Lactococcus lactis]MDN6224581.1 DUF4649 family protein [Lactococcus lactis]MDN6237626.1 DUF4649 family protein [Lactococcus lactis]
MMKLIGKLQNGMTFTEEFDGVNDFLALQQSDYNAIADEIEVVEVKIADEVLDFKGNMGQLYYELMKINKKLLTVLLVTFFI